MTARFFKVCAAALLAIGLSTVSIAAPADAAILKQASSGPSTSDTGWGFK
jgi:hypothetical protein